MTQSPNRRHSLQTRAASLEVPRPPARLANWPQICGFPWAFQVQQLATFKITVFLCRIQIRTSQTKRQRGWVRTQSSCALSLWVGTQHPSHTSVCSPVRKLHRAQGPEFVLGFHYWGMVNQNFGQVIQLNFQPPSLFHRRGWPNSSHQWLSPGFLSG